MHACVLAEVFTLKDGHILNNYVRMYIPVVATNCLVDVLSSQVSIYQILLNTHTSQISYLNITYCM